MRKGTVWRGKVRVINLIAACSLMFVIASGASAATNEGSSRFKVNDLPRSIDQSSDLMPRWRLQSEVFNLVASFEAGSIVNSNTSPVISTVSISTATSSTTTTVPSSPNTSAVPSFLHGVYVGPADPTGVQAFESATGEKVTLASDYLPSNDGWAGMDGAGGNLTWLTNAWRSSGYTLSLGVPMIPTNAEGVPQGTLGDGATGSYDAYYVSLARALVAAGEGNSYLRLGWEFDGNWFSWQALTPAAESSYANYFRQIVTAMRSVAGEDFQFVWNPDASAFTNSGYSVAAAYPGNAYVNVIGIDLYDMSWVSPLTPTNVWSAMTLPALTAADNFAKAQGKPMAVCEWGVLFRDGHGLGDDPLYVNNMIAWMDVSGHDVAYESYFDGNTQSGGADQDQNVTDGLFPDSSAALRAGFG
jgi:hypothetical protein